MLSVQIDFGLGLQMRFFSEWSVSKQEQEQINSFKLVNSCFLGSLGLKERD